jgi:hypothetical protein
VTIVRVHPGAQLAAAMALSASRGILARTTATWWLQRRRSKIR